MKMLRCTVFLVGISLCATAAMATTVRAFDTRGLVVASDRIVRAQVIESKSFWSRGRTRVYTDTVFRVRAAYYERQAESTQRPSARDELVVRQLGGTMDGARMTVPGTTSFQRGDDVVLFLRCHSGFHTLVGMAQGVVRIQRTPNGLTASSDLEGAHLIQDASETLGTPDIQGSEPVFWTPYRTRLTHLIQQRIIRENSE